MLNFFAGIQKLVFGSADLNSIYQGHIAEHIVGQEFLANQPSLLEPLRFWVREKKGSVAELDYLYGVDGEMFPVEVKSGATGTLRSLHLYMENSGCNMAIRLYSGPFEINNIKTSIGKKYKLLNLPYYLAGKLPEYIS